MIRFPSLPQLISCKLENITSWKLKKSQSINNINYSSKERVFLETVENLDCPTLHFLSKSPRKVLEDRIIRRLIATLVHYNFSALTMTRTIEYTRLSANLAFQILVQGIPMTKYALLSEYIANNIWYDQDDNNVTTIWPFKFLSILIDRGHMLKGENFLRALYVHCVHNTYLNPIKPSTRAVKSPRGIIKT